MVLLLAGALRPEAAEPKEWLLVIGEKCNLRAAPKSDSELVVELKKFTPLLALGVVEDDYHKVKTEPGKTGWAHKSVVRESNYVSIGDFTAGAQPDEAVKFYREPDKDSALAFEFVPEPYYPLKVLDRQGEYVNVQDWEKDSGWVHESLIATKRCCIVNIGEANVRGGPGTENELVCVLEKGVLLEIVSQEGKWLQVKHKDGSAGWISANIVWGADPEKKQPEQ
jgi:SH3-like domain-containing protein